MDELLSIIEHYEKSKLNQIVYLSMVFSKYRRGIQENLCVIT
ncbi:MAG: hypothetical protein ACYCZ1_08875 [Candidatus Humimicrobiaceae bacterium]